MDSYVQLLDNQVGISRERYEELLKKEKFLDLLELAGVDNWEGYDYAMEELRES